MKLIDRTKYLAELEDLLQTPDIKVITGVHRSRKSKLLDALVAYLQEKDPKVNIRFFTVLLTGSTPIQPQ